MPTKAVVFVAANTGTVEHAIPTRQRSVPKKNLPPEQFLKLHGMGVYYSKSNKRLNQSELFQLIILLLIHKYKYYWCVRMLLIQNNETLVMGWENYAIFEYLTPKILIIDKVENAAILRHSL